MRPFLMIGAILIALVACEQDEMAVGEVREPEILTTDTAGTTAEEPLAAPGWPANDWTWGQWATWEGDGDNQLTRAEWDARFGNVYETWAGADATLTRDEAADTWADWFDSNDDNIIDANEWNRGTTSFADTGYQWGDFRTWDANGDGQLTADEWDRGFVNAAPANATWTREEMADTWWGYFDADNDEVIEPNEWSERSAYWENAV